MWHTKCYGNQPAGPHARKHSLECTHKIYFLSLRKEELATKNQASWTLTINFKSDNSGCLNSKHISHTEEE